jgi:hypothetical protein
MERKKIVLIAVAVVFSGVFACTSQEKAPKQENIQGMVKIYGNEPHTWVGIETVEEKIYTVFPPETAAELRKVQGRLLELTVVLEGPAKRGIEGKATVLSWRIVPANHAGS